jgi:tetratricopeptide (TPR) repeat protein
MNRFAIRLLTLAVFSMALLAAPTFMSIAAAGGDPPSTSPPPPPPTDTKVKKKKTSEATPPGAEDPAFAAGYRTAYATIYNRNDNAAVANLIGYSYRKLGDYKVSQIWYERALKIDPDHVKTWQYYGLWQVEQGNRDQAQYHLNRLASLVGTDSEEYRSLAAALEQPPGTGLVY